MYSKQMWWETCASLVSAGAEGNNVFLEFTIELYSKLNNLVSSSGSPVAFNFAVIKNKSYFLALKKLMVQC